MIKYPDNTIVFVNYTGTLSDGTVFDSTVDEEPLEITIGTEMVLPKFEEAIQTLDLNEKITISIPSDDAYGSYEDELVITMPKDNFPQDIPMERGVELTLHSPDDEEFPAVIIDITETDVVIDANHPLAGEDLSFSIELVQIG